MPSPAVAGVPYRFQLEATDPNGDKLTYTISSATTDLVPEGLHVSDDDDGVLSWDSPEPSADGSAYTFDVTVSDGRGGSDQNATAYSLSVSTAVKNNPPEIRTEPRATIRAGQLYVSPIEVFDPDGDALTLTLEEWPAGMEVVEANGVYALKWDTREHNVAIGTYQGLLKLADGRGEYDLKSFTVEVTRARPTPGRRSIQSPA